MPACASDYPVGLAGECLAPGSPSQPIALTRISTRDCRAIPAGGRPPPGTEVVIWIGAIGPLRATVHGDPSGEMALRFCDPLADAVVEHFASV